MVLVKVGQAVVDVAGALERRGDVEAFSRNEIQRPRNKEREEATNRMEHVV